MQDGNYEHRNPKTGRPVTIADLVDFTKTFLAKRTLLNVLTKFCVLDSSNTLLVMRPYQIVAAEQVLHERQKRSFHVRQGQPLVDGKQLAGPWV